LRGEAYSEKIQLLLYTQKQEFILPFFHSGLILLNGKFKTSAVQDVQSVSIHACIFTCLFVWVLTHVNSYVYMYSHRLIYFTLKYVLI